MTDSSCANPEPSGTVLIADNDAGVNGLLQEVLRKRGMRTEAVYDGADALGRLLQGGVSLLVCDLDMPTLAGQELLAHLASIPGAPPAIVVSGYVDESTEAQLRALPVVRGVLAKPFDVFEFAELAASLVAGDGAAATAASGSGPR